MQVFKLKSSLSLLASRTESLCAALEGASMICANKPGPFLRDGQAFSLACSIYKNLWVEDSAADGRETPVVIGAIEASADAFAIASEINQIKDDLKAQFIELRDSTGQDLSRAGRDKSFRRELADIGLGKLSIRQVNRHIPLIHECPKKIDFSYSTKGKSISKLSVEEALNLLASSAMVGAHIEIQMKRLMSLPEDYPLAQVQKMAAFYKANIRLHSGHRYPMQVFMPIIYLKGEHPVILPAELKSIQRIRSSTQGPRKDLALDPEPIAPSLRLYQYISKV